MFKESSLFFMYTETPFHPGAGDSVSYVDQPVQREKHTNYPLIQSSGVKGAYRDWAGHIYKNNPAKKSEIKKAFGPEPGEGAGEHSGALSFTDAQILLFPVRSFRGGFAWVTCPLAVNRFCRVLAMTGGGVLNLKEPKEEEVLVPTKPGVVADNLKVILEDFAFDVNNDQSEKVDALACCLVKKALPNDPVFDYLKNHLKTHLVILNDSRFKDFVTLSTQIVTRVRIGSSGTVETGFLWTEELIPPDTLFYSLALAKDLTLPEGATYRATDAMRFLGDMFLENHLLQLGGDETVGRGLIHLQFLENTSCIEFEKEVGKEISNAGGN